ncbi:MAG: YdcF family protein [Anaerolineaceae bacterium]|nr:YdcF family protein [Anaerolineaceae bacterium]
MNDQTFNSSPPSKSRSFLHGCLIFFLVILLILVAIWFSMVGAASYLNVGDRVKPVDAIVVLSGDEGDRILEAVKWYKQSYGKYFVITKTHTEDIGEGRTYSEMLMRIAMEGGVPADSMLFTEGEASSTLEEARAIKILAQKRNIKSILVITAPYHTRRTMIIFDHEFFDTDIKVLVHPVEDSWYRPLTWYLSSEGWRQTLAEYASLFLIWFGR